MRGFPELLASMHDDRVFRSLALAFFRPGFLVLDAVGCSRAAAVKNPREGNVFRLAAGPEGAQNSKPQRTELNRVTERLRLVSAFCLSFQLGR